MKTLLSAVFILSIGFANAQTDSLSVSDQSFNRTYDQSCALVINGMWSGNNGSKPIGFFWQKVAPEFDLSLEGKKAYILGQKQSKTGFGLAMAGLGTFVSGTVIMLSGIPYRYNSNSNGSLDNRLGIGFGLWLGSFVLNTTSIGYNIKGYDNFEKAVWLRNRDAMLLNLPAATQPQFKQIYEQEAIYLSQGGFFQRFGYIKNNQRRIFEFLGNAAQSEFQGSIQGLDSYKKYQRNQVAGVAVYVLSLASIFGSSYLGRSSSNRSSFLPLYIGGLVGAGISGGLMASAYNHLRRAVYFHNRDVVRQRLMFQ